MQTTSTARARVRAFRGWFLLYSFLYFMSLNITGDVPGGEKALAHKAVNYVVLLVLSYPLWRVSRDAVRQLGEPDGDHPYISLAVKCFLLALGTNGLLTFDTHEGLARTFYLWNGIVLWAYALPALALQIVKLRRAPTLRT